jgi:hypothetical protein
MMMIMTTPIHARAIGQLGTGVEAICDDQVAPEHVMAIPPGNSPHHGIRKEAPEVASGLYLFAARLGFWKAKMLA